MVSGVNAMGKTRKRGSSNEFWAVSGLREIILGTEEKTQQLPGKL